jgi:hypothetical protein
MDITKADLKKIINDEPQEKRKRRRVARDIAAAGDYNSRLEIERQLRRRHSMRGEGRKWEREVSVIEWIHQARSKGKTMGAKFNTRTKVLATSAFSYTLRDRSLWIWPHDLTYYVNAWASGHLTDEEMQEFLTWLQHCQ